MHGACSSIKFLLINSNKVAVESVLLRPAITSEGILADG